MSPATWITMIALLTLVWGGFGLAILIAFRKELIKRE
jgi:hypothetical protein